MNTPHTKKTQKEKKTHPFLFLFLLSFVGVGALASWNTWEKGMGQQRLKDLVRSDDIEILLEGGAFSEKETLAALSRQLNDNLYNSLPKNLFSKKSDAADSSDTAGDSSGTDELKPTAKEATEAKNNSLEDTLPVDKRDETSEDAFMEGVLGYSRDAVSLALRDIFISQGANGVENWRLKAEWATLRQTTAILSIKNPSLLYRTNPKASQANKEVQKTNDFSSKSKNTAELKPFKIVQSKKNSDGKKNNSNPNVNNLQKDFFNNSQAMLLITAKNGLIFDNNTKIHLTQEVVARQEDTCVQGDTLNYDDSTKIAKFPDLAKFSSTNMQGQALELSWDLAKNQLIGSGNIEMTWAQSGEKP